MTKAETIRRVFEWEREKKFQLLSHKLNKGVESLDNISEAMNSRLFRLQRAFDEIQRNNPPDSVVLMEYRTSVVHWNTKLNFFEAELERPIGEEYRHTLNAYESGQYAARSTCPDKPPSIHAKFWCANSALNELKACRKCAD